MSDQGKPKHKPPFYQAFLAACFFGLLWGGWAYFANRSHGNAAAQRAFITQFTFSFIATFFFALVVDCLYLNATTLAGKLLLSGLLPVSVMIALLSTVHYFRGTPNILATVTPSSTIAALYCALKIGRGYWVSRYKNAIS
ncbi:hypothetical protein EDC30_10872 [Paucimonas lemoignei]|uniref:Uncharacterized protein n=1 Tax=Paucimonas lemoignei TaxID=29443 RepID=A0A4R3HX72_PAULE|nr:hypothetical protein [Paucimonas lemoignei]TCS36009.1 hypothetical protein EDC30_10872 [Paucimonas lemoignei]